MVDVITFGETMARLTAPSVGPLRHATTLSLSIAGAESNVAIALSRLGAAAHWIGRVGDDEFGRLVIGILRAEGIGLDVVVDVGAPTGVLLKERRTSTTSRVQYYRAGSAGSRLVPENLPANRIAEARVVHLTGITAAISATALAACHSAIDVAAAAGTAVSFDLNFRRALWSEEEAAPVLRDLTSRADIVFATVAEARLVVDGNSPGELAQALSVLGPREVLIKDGARGATAMIDGDVFVAGPFAVAEIDPVGAGDAFAAGYLAERCLGAGPMARLDTAARCGAFAVTVDGDWEGSPSRADLTLLGGEEVVR